MSETKSPRALRLNEADNIVVAVDTFAPGFSYGGVIASERVPRGHKMAIAPIAAGEPVRKFGQIIGFASKSIAPGQWVHEHNVECRDFERDYAFAQEARDEAILPESGRATFEGFCRANGKVGTRNYIAILTSVNCSASVARFMAEEIHRSGVLDQYPGIDGVIPLTHGGGCALDVKGEGYEVYDKATAFANIEGVSGQQSTVTSLRVFGYLIGALVIGVFFYVLTLQKIPQIGVLKAIGASNLFVFRQILLQVVGISLIGLAISVPLAMLTDAGLRRLPDAVPIAFTTGTFVTTAALLLVTSIVGTAFSARQVIKVDPIIALGQQQ